eukprot:8719216-Pyramimonas_sp.AAC.1
MSERIGGGGGNKERNEDWRMAEDLSLLELSIGRQRLQTDNLRALKRQTVGRRSLDGTSWLIHHPPASSIRPPSTSSAPSSVVDGVDVVDATSSSSSSSSLSSIVVVDRR